MDALGLLFSSGRESCSIMFLGLRKGQNYNVTFYISKKTYSSVPHGSVCDILISSGVVLGGLIGSYSLAGDNSVSIHRQLEVCLAVHPTPGRILASILGNGGEIWTKKLIQLHMVHLLGAEASSGC